MFERTSDVDGITHYTFKFQIFGWQILATVLLALIIFN